MKFEAELREDILALVAPIEIWVYVALVNKSRLVDECNNKLAVARSDAYKKKLVPHRQKFKPQT